MGVAYAFETHALLANEVGAAERRYRQHIILARKYELQFRKAEKQLKKLNLELDLTVVAALRKAAPATIPGRHDTPGCEHMDLQARCPDILRLPMCARLPRKPEIHLTI